MYIQLCYTFNNDFTEAQQFYDTHITWLELDNQCHTVTVFVHPLTIQRYSKLQVSIIHQGTCQFDEEIRINYWIRQLHA